MITLEAADLIEGDASAANAVDYIINGVQEASSVVSVKALADGQLPASKGTLYTTPASTTAIVKSVILVNADSSARTVNLYVQRDGSNSRRIIPENLSLEANGGSAILADQLYVFSAAGELLYKVNYPAHASNHITGGPDEVDGDKLDIDWNPSNYTPATTPSEADNVDNLTAHLYGIDQELGQKLENIVEDTSPQLGGDLDAQTKRIYDVKVLDFKAPTELTIAIGAITVTQTFHTVDTEGDAASDDLDTINGGSDGRLIVLKPINDARTVVVKHNTGNIWLQGKADISLDDISDGLMLVYSATDSKWFDIAAGGGGGGGSSTFLGLTDTPASFSGKAGQVPKVNSGENALDFDPRGFTLLAEEEVTGSATTTITITGLDLDSSKMFILCFSFKGANSATTGYVYYNNDTTNANYDQQSLQVNGTTVSGARFTGPGLPATAANGRCYAIAFIMRDPDGYVRLNALTIREEGTSVKLVNKVFVWATTNNVTRIDLTANQTNGLAVGTKVLLFGVAG